MKKSIFTLAFLAVMGWVSAQSLQFEKDGYVYGQGETVICTHVEEWGEMIQEMQLRNNTSSSLQVMVMREVVEIVEGTENSFCWGSCYAPTVNVSPRPVEMEAGALSAAGLLSFHHLIDPTYSGDPENFIPGTSIVKYYAYPEGNEDDRVCVEVHFVYDPSSVSEQPVLNFGHAYPNPATSMVRFDYNISSASNASVAIYNLLGQEVMRQPLTTLQGTAAFSVADLNEGIYFCNLFVNGQAVKAEKFIVKK